MKKPPLVYVLWSDSCSPGDSGWHVGEQHEWMGETFLIEDVGFLIKEYKDRIVIVGGYHGDTDTLQTHRELMIPRGCIVKMKRVRV